MFSIIMLLLSLCVYVRINSIMFLGLVCVYLRKVPRFNGVMILCGYVANGGCVVGYGILECYTYEALMSMC